MEDAPVVIVGAGPSGLATSACLNILHVRNIVLEREDCYGPLWKKRTYDRLKLHIPKKFCELPYMSFPEDAPQYVPKKGFIAYLDNYMSTFRVNPLCNRLVRSAYYNSAAGRWKVEVENKISDCVEGYDSKFLVAATGENGEGYIPDVPGLDTFDGEYMHSSQFQNGKMYEGQRVLVVGCGNSGMEIAYDLSKSQAKTFIIARSPVHIVTKEIVYLGMVLLKFLPMKTVDKIIVRLCKLKDGNISKFGLQRPKEGPFHIKKTTGRSPTIDVGCLKKIKKGKVKVFKSTIKSIKGKRIEFIDGEIRQFNVIIFATGYKNTVKNWLKDGGDLFGDNGMPKKSLLNKWKGRNGLYCVGFARNGLMAISSDAKTVARDIRMVLNKKLSD